MTFPEVNSEGHFCPECQIHRTTAAERPCPCCAPTPTPKFPGPPSRMALDPISTTSGDL